MKIAVIGSGISGVSVARMLNSNHDVTVFEDASKKGGLIKCDRIHDILFHRVGGHVFNSRNQRVLDWFWSFFDRENEFLQAKRNAKILLDGKFIGYPIENYLYQLHKEDVEQIFHELIDSSQDKNSLKADNFEAFLQQNFGSTLYKRYFGPYNAKIWKSDLSKVSLDWLDGKLPMPNLKEIILSNIFKEEEGSMVHATFYYAKENGSQFIIDRLSEGVNIRCSSPVTKFEKIENGWCLNESEIFDAVVFTGDCRKLYSTIAGLSEAGLSKLECIQDLQSNGTSNLLCETDPTDISWLYLPNPDLKCHRIIYTGTFSETNNRLKGRISCVVEFSGYYSHDEMVSEISKLPGNLTPIESNYEANSYIIQKSNTRQLIAEARKYLKENNFYLLGRFAEWEYYNMDKCIESAMKINNTINQI